MKKINSKEAYKTLKNIYERHSFYNPDLNVQVYFEINNIV